MGQLQNIIFISFKWLLFLSFFPAIEKSYIEMQNFI